ncbi:MULTISPECIES: cytochrome P450 [unclassified Crossiella]|uniref:cytochrome P450 n=1 Tax=unclassified Crossiella TaxID=2620835 RepID=UPI001FFE97DE|nr:MULTISPECIES: cytochrome P450 [unclassified Crossiella]MCK2243097.1 cytochrome P450 [Crossiella sp. S99.2]MCK2256974.1 cytochrome P450 [Crossiella sp. S99.1]
MSAVEVVAGYVRIVDLISDALLTLLGCPEQLAVLRRDPQVLAAVIREVLRGDADAGDLGFAGVVAEAAVRAVLGCDVLLAGDEEELRWRARLGIRELRSIPVILVRRPAVGGGR